MYILVRRMQIIIGQFEAQKQRIDLKNILDHADHGNGAALADQEWCLIPDFLERLAACGVRWVRSSRRAPTRALPQRKW